MSREKSSAQDFHVLPSDHGQGLQLQQYLLSLEKDNPRIHDSMIEKIHEIAESMPGIVGLNNDPDSSVTKIIEDICSDLSNISANNLRGGGNWAADNRDEVADQSTEMINKLENLYHGFEA